VKVKPRRGETHGTDPSPCFSLSLLDPPDAAKQNTQGGEEGERKEEEAEIPSPSPKS
jgi:hypothetical protein